MSPVPPTLLGRMIEGMPPVSAVESERSDWMNSPFTLQMEQRLIEELYATWREILNAKSWDEYLAFRGSYEMLERMLQLKEESGPSSALRSTPQEIEEAKASIQEISNAIRRE